MDRRTTKATICALAMTSLLPACVTERYFVAPGELARIRAAPSAERDAMEVPALRADDKTPVRIRASTVRESSAEVTANPYFLSVQTSATSGVVGAAYATGSVGLVGLITGLAIGPRVCECQADKVPVGFILVAASIPSLITSLILFSISPSQRPQEIGSAKAANALRPAVVVGTGGPAVSVPLW